jgi:integrating conjugative element protein (TIGR03765 family)
MPSGRLQRAGCFAHIGVLVASTQAEPLGPTLPLLEVLQVGPMATPIAPYLTPLVSSDPQATGSVMPHLQFPVRTSLRRGVLGAEHQVLQAMWMVHPIFLVGADAASLSWLRHNTRALQAMQAVGVVVQAETAEEFRRIQRTAPALAYAPGSGPWLDGTLQRAGAAVYPVLIDTQGMVRQILPRSPALQELP